MKYVPFLFPWFMPSNLYIVMAKMSASTSDASQAARDCSGKGALSASHWVRHRNMKADSSPVSFVQDERLSCFLVRRKAMDSYVVRTLSCYGENFKLGSALIEFAMPTKGQWSPSASTTRPRSYDNVQQRKHWRILPHNIHMTSINRSATMYPSSLYDDDIEAALKINLLAMNEKDDADVDPGYDSDDEEVSKYIHCRTHVICHSWWRSATVLLCSYYMDFDRSEYAGESNALDSTNL